MWYIEYSSCQCKCGQLCLQRWCFRSLKRFEKLQKDTKTLLRTLKENFVRNNRVRRGVPWDLAISPSVAAPTKSLHHREDQILPKPNPEDVIFWLTETP